jgi:Protein of unknown function (DUF4245)
VSTQSQIPAARPRGPGRSVVGLLWSLVPIVVVLILLVLWQRGSPSPAVSVDPGPDIEYAERVSPVPLPAPGPLPGDWRATSSHVDAPAADADVGQPTLPRRSPVTLTIGYLTENEKFAEVVVGDRSATTLLNETAPQATRDGDAAVGTGRWDVYRNQRGEQVLVTTIGKAGVLVTGDASEADLTSLARTVTLPAP